MEFGFSAGHAGVGSGRWGQGKSRGQISEGPLPRNLDSSGGLSGIQRGVLGSDLSLCSRGKKPSLSLFFLSRSVSHELTFFHSGFPDLQPERLGGLVPFAHESSSEGKASCFSVVWKSAFLKISPCSVENSSFSCLYG